MSDSLFSDIFLISLESLYPYFEVGPIQLPRFCFANRAYFDSAINSIALSPTDLEPCRNQTLGHELGHALHAILRPEIYEAYGEDMEASNLAELVAQYTGLTFQRSLSSVRLKETKHKARDAYANCEIDAPWLPEVQIDPLLDHQIHEGGCRAASWLRAYYADTLLHFFARASIERAQEKLEEIGYPYPLFVDDERSISYLNQNGLVYEMEAEVLSIDLIPDFQPLFRDIAAKE